MCVNSNVFSDGTNPNYGVVPSDRIFYIFAIDVCGFINFINRISESEIKNDFEPKELTILIQNIFELVHEKFENGPNYKFSDVLDRVSPIILYRINPKIKREITKSFNKICSKFCIDSIKPSLGLICKALDRSYEKFQSLSELKFFEAFYAIKEEENSKIQYENGKQEENKVKTEPNKSENKTKEVSSEETNNNNDKDQENETNENENNNTKKDPWFFIIRNAKVEVGV